MVSTNTNYGIMACMVAQQYNISDKIPMVSRPPESHRHRFVLESFSPSSPSLFLFLLFFLFLSRKEVQKEWNRPGSPAPDMRLCALGRQQNYFG